MTTPKFIPVLQERGYVIKPGDVIAEMYDRPYAVFVMLRTSVAPAALLPAVCVSGTDLAEQIDLAAMARRDARPIDAVAIKLFGAPAAMDADERVAFMMRLDREAKDVEADIRRLG